MKKDDLFKSFSQFEIRKNNTCNIVGGESSAANNDPDGCTTAWTDDCDGNTTSHMHDSNG